METEMSDKTLGSRLRGYRRETALEKDAVLDGQRVWCIVFEQGGWSGGDGTPFSGSFKFPGHVVREGIYDASIQCARVKNTDGVTGIMGSLEAMAGRGKASLDGEMFFALDEFWLTKEEPYTFLEAEWKKMQTQMKDVFTIKPHKFVPGDRVHVVSDRDRKFGRSPVDANGTVTLSDGLSMAGYYHQVALDGKEDDGYWFLEPELSFTGEPRITENIPKAFEKQSLFSTELVSVQPMDAPASGSSTVYVDFVSGNEEPFWKAFAVPFEPFIYDGKIMIGQGRYEGQESYLYPGGLDTKLGIPDKELFVKTAMDHDKAEYARYTKNKPLTEEQVTKQEKRYRDFVDSIQEGDLIYHYKIGGVLDMREGITVLQKRGEEWYTTGGLFLAMS